MKHGHTRECGACAQIGFWAPWGLLAAGAGISLVSALPPVAHEGAAYLIALALLLMLVGVVRRGLKLF